jgi:hypothetical protein
MTHRKGFTMKTALFTAAAITSAVILAPQLLAAAAAPAQQAGAATAQTAGTANTQTTAPRYEWRYHYVGRHARMEGYWAPVK